MSDPG